MASTLSESIARNFPRMPIGALNLRNDWRTRYATYNRRHDNCRCRPPAVGCQQVHPHAGTSQIDPERTGGGRFGLVDRESVWGVRSPPSIPRRTLKDRLAEFRTA